MKSDEYTARLEFLAQRWPQAEIARRTNTQRNNVSRYLRGGKMPLEFGAALTRQLGVNPAWLLTGEGTPFLSDVSANTGKMAGDLLELVAAMNAVTSSQLGSLTGAHHLRVLRELNDALQRYEKLRLRINEATGPIFARILDDYWKALDKWQLEKADDLRKAARQIARLCDDDELQNRFDRTLAYHAFLAREEGESIRAQTRLFRRTLGGDGMIDERGLREATNLANALQSVGRLREAFNLCEGALTLAGEEFAGNAVARFLRSLSGFILCEEGALHEGMRRITGALPQPDARLAGNQRSMLIRVLLLSGSISFADAANMGDCGPAHAGGMITYALALGTPDELALAVQRFSEPAATDRNARVGRLVLDGMHGRGGNACAEFAAASNAKPGGPVNERFDDVIFRCLVARHAKLKHARKLHAEAEAILKSAPPRVHMAMLAMTVHHGNALALLPKTDPGQATAAAFFADHIPKGYAVFTRFTT